MLVRDEVHSGVGLWTGVEGRGGRGSCVERAEAHHRGEPVQYPEVEVTRVVGGPNAGVGGGEAGAPLPRET